MSWPFTSQQITEYTKASAETNLSSKRCFTLNWTTSSIFTHELPACPKTLIICCFFLCERFSSLALICITYFRNFTAWKGSSGTHKRKCSINYTNRLFFHIYQTSELFNMETFKCNSLAEKICMFLQKETSHCKSSLALGPQGPKQYIFGDYFYSNNAGKLIFYVFLLFHVRKHMTSSFYLKWTELTRNCDFCSICESLGTRIKLEQIHNFLWIRSTLGKIIISYVS